MNREILNQIKQKALEDRIPILMDDTLNIIKQELQEIKPTRILEIGTAVGYSAICFSEYLTNNGKIDTIEKDEIRAAEAIQNIAKMGLEEKIHVFTGDAIEILPTFQTKYDIIFIDASKTKYPLFLEQAIRLSHTSTKIIADNILYKGYVLGEYTKHKQRTAVRNLREYLKQIEENPILETQILEVGDGLAISTVLEEKNK